MIALAIALTCAILHWVVLPLWGRYLLSIDPYGTLRAVHGGELRGKHLVLGVVGALVRIVGIISTVVAIWTIFV
jgi:hypothetical protein